MEMLDRVGNTFEELSTLSDAPFAFFFEPASAVNRIANQYALFSVTTDPTVCIDQLPNLDAGFKKLVIPKEVKLEIRDKLDYINISERMIYHLRLSGVLASTRALIVGQFTEYKPSKDFDNMYDMVQRIVADYDFPVAYNFPVGHVDHNLPIVEGSHAHLEVAADGVRLTLSQE